MLFISIGLMMSFSHLQQVGGGPVPKEGAPSDRTQASPVGDEHRPCGKGDTAAGIG